MRRQLIRFTAILFFIIISVPICILSYSGAYILFYLFKLYNLFNQKK